MAEAEEGTVILQGEDGQPLTEEEIQSLLAQHGGGEAEDGTAQIIDAEGNAVTVTAEQMAAVGIDPNNMTEINEDQIQQLLQLAQGGAVVAEEGGAAEATPPAPETQKVEDLKPAEAVERAAAGGGDAGSSTAGGAEEPPGELTMVIGDDGSLRLVDTTGTEFLLGPEQLATAGIDPANLTEENVQTIVQLAISAGASAGVPAEPAPKRKATEMADARMPKRMRMDELPPELTQAVAEDGTLRLLDQNGQEVQVAVSDHVSSAMPKNVGTVSPRMRGSGGRGFALIGQEVEVKKGGRTFNATIRYCRSGNGYKVQFDDGHFEWVAEDQVTLKSAKRVSEGHMRESLSPMTSKTPNGVPGVSSALGRRVPPAIPGIRVSSQGDAHAKMHQTPNFFCPICENKVYQKEPAYIVIRLPACESCADSKILVLDQDTPPTSNGGNSGPAAKEPSQIEANPTSNQEPEPEPEAPAPEDSSGAGTAQLDGESVSLLEEASA